MSKAVYLNGKRVDPITKTRIPADIDWRAMILDGDPPAEKRKPKWMKPKLREVK